eukprot:2371460-Pyramimonas_sp.AAC.1
MMYCLTPGSKRSYSGPFESSIPSPHGTPREATALVRPSWPANNSRKIAPLLTRSVRFKS